MNSCSGRSLGERLKTVTELNANDTTLLIIDEDLTQYLFTHLQMLHSLKSGKMYWNLKQTYV
jgi:hypothetical protein